ncbi:MAG: cob(I)yrinic acid a,c-diamide adenosyltransferase [Alphaproteobacteria bacterium]|nr:cob(I)yrinic acid a,c-diamide adenosyltransferase [Alphaproteobacteria bacterium]
MTPDTTDTTDNAGTADNAGTTAAPPPADVARHAEKMRIRKAAQDKKVSGKEVAEKGLLMVHTGTGKGKTTAAMGLAFRALGQGKSVCIVQFVKGAWATGEFKALSAFTDRCSYVAMGEGFTWETQDKSRDIMLAGQAWDAAVAAIADPRWDMVILDELNIVLRYGYLDTESVVDVLRDRRPLLHVVATGRNAPAGLLEIADMVTVMTAERHHFRDGGVRAQVGIEY